MLWRIRGSSPLTRGKPDARRAPPPGHRLIPAHAGKTSRLAGSFWWPGAHPRSRGENVVATLSSKSLTGSSPLTRGKRFGHLVEVLDAGLIPAHAGKTPKASERPGTHRAHPRSRGENVTGTLVPGVQSGSSPLTRGKLSCGRLGCRLVGLIPAHAGKTARSPCTRAAIWAHPRSRGENRRGPVHVVGEDGSSPLTRGKHIGEAKVQDGLGLIPAHAGKTPKASERPGTHRAHPRSRGENSFTPPMIVACKGSSPLTRGKLACFGRADPIPGFIPAHAGKTLVSGSKLSARAAHPRSRGENAETVNSTVSKSGSSPLTRGKRTHRHNHTNTRRLIPAHAGKTS